MDETSPVNTNTSDDQVIVRQLDTAITSDSGNSSNSQPGSSTFGTSSNPQINPKEVDVDSADQSTIVFEKVALEKPQTPQSPAKNAKKRSTFKVNKTLPQKAANTSSSSSVEFDFGGQSVIVQKLKSVSNDDLDQFTLENEKDQMILNNENNTPIADIIEEQSPLSSDSESKQKTGLDLEKPESNNTNKLLLEVRSPSIKNVDTPRLLKNSKNVVEQKKPLPIEPVIILKPEKTEKVVVQGKLAPFMKKYKTAWLIGDPAESSRLVVGSEDTVDHSTGPFENFTVGTIKGVKENDKSGQVKRYNTFASLGSSNGHQDHVVAIPGTSSEKLIQDNDNSNNQDSTNKPSAFTAFKNKIKQKFARKNSSNENIEKTAGIIDQNENDRWLKSKFVYFSILAVFIIILWSIAVYYTLNFQSPADKEYNITKNENLINLASTPMKLPIKRVFLVVDDCRASKNSCDGISNGSTLADFRSFQITTQKEVKEIYGFQMPSSEQNRTTLKLLQVTKPSNFLRIAFKCDAGGLDANQTETLYHFLDDHVVYGDVAHNYSIITNGKEIKGCELNRSEIGLKDEFAGHFVEALNITKLLKFTNNSTSKPRKVDGMIWDKIIFVQLSNKSLSNLKNYANYGINFLVNSKGRIFEHLGWSQILDTNKSNVLRIVFWVKNQTVEKPTQAALDSAQNLINYGIQLGFIDEHYKVIQF